MLPRDINKCIRSSSTLPLIAYCSNIAFTADTGHDCGSSFSQINWEEETVFEFVKSITRMVMVRSEKQEDTDPNKHVQSLLLHLLRLHQE